ncbi:hypothetical protein DYB38_008843 [Aphanomyces astaci]|uniref:Uncharacterized protein n=1 Tax=Aphanomyces astaci TaxID=112090 RepID=A0A397FDE8_APHAT|nr:hypothetical protein DYB36_000988 [Aphanomyces astaci]RHY50759.1 hypothetical protein DYB38_008843 [Aphanomyces astaci]RHY58031.1 hypothetical protein DYB34_000181 [Aphanomyces astaci]RHZ26692.1 hypothetical protein DYB31_003480 [Aphanomyces astaci]
MLRLAQNSIATAQVHPANTKKKVSKIAIAIPKAECMSPAAEWVTETLGPVSMSALDDDDDVIHAHNSTKPAKSRIMRKFENVQATLGSELIVNRRNVMEHSATLPMLNTHNGALVIIPPLTRSATDPTPHTGQAIFGRPNFDNHASSRHLDHPSRRTSDL